VTRAEARTSPAILTHAERLSSDFGASCPNGVCPPGVGFGSNLNESQYSWSNWTLAMDQVVGVIRLQANVDNIILLPGLDWSYDYLGACARGRAARLLHAVAPRRAPRAQPITTRGPRPSLQARATT